MVLNTSVSRHAVGIATKTSRIPGKRSGSGREVGLINYYTEYHRFEDLLGFFMTVYEYFK